MTNEFRTLKLHETVSIEDGTQVMRVLDGWVYTFTSLETGDVTSSVFVPDNRFKR